MFDFITRWLVCLVLLAVVVWAERSLKDAADNIFDTEQQALLVWLFANVCLIVGTAVTIGME